MLAVLKNHGWVPYYCWDLHTNPNLKNYPCAKHEAQGLKLPMHQENFAAQAYNP